MNILELNLKELCKGRQIKDVSSFLRNHGFTRAEVRTLLNPNVKSDKRKHLALLMEIFDCRMDELYVYRGTNANHPMARVRPVKGTDMAEVLSGLNMTEVLELTEMMKKSVEELKRKRGG